MKHGAQPVVNPPNAEMGRYSLGFPFFYIKEAMI